MLRATALVCAALVIASASGCGNRTVFVPESSPMRTGPGFKGRIYTLRPGASPDEWELSANAVSIPEGYYLVSPQWVSENEDK